MVVRDRSGTEPAAGDAAAAGCEQPTVGQPRGGGHGVSGAGTRGLRGRRERKNDWYRWVSDNLPPLFFFSAPIAKSQMARPSRSQGVPSRRSASTTR